MSLIRKEIRAKIVEILLNKTDAQYRVFPSRILPVWEQELPAILVYANSDTREIDSQPKRYRVDLQVVIQVIQKVSSKIDDELDLLGSQVEYQLDQDYSLGGLVEDIIHTSSELAMDKEGDTEIGKLELNFTCRYYQDSVADPEMLDDFDRLDTDWYPNDATTASVDTHDTITGLSL